MVYLLFSITVVLLCFTALIKGFRIKPAFHSSQTSTRIYGLFDDLKLIFSKEGQENIKSFNEREKEEQLKLQKEILERYTLIYM